MRVLLVTAGLAALLVAGCGGGGPSKASRRDAVTRYINAVDAQERQSQRQLQAVESAYRSFSGDAAKLRGALPRFERGETTFRAVGRRLAALPAPPDALVLRRRLLALVDAEIGLAHEVTLLASFLPRFQTALAPLDRARKTLQGALAATSTPTPKRVPRSQLKAAQAAYAAAVAVVADRRAEAITAYLDSIARVESALRKLRPPAVMAPTRAAELGTLSGLRAAGAKLVAALRARKYTSVPALSRSFQAAALTSASVASQRAEIAAVRAYNARVRGTGVLAVRIEREQARLQKLLS